MAIWTHATAGLWGFGDVRLSRVIAAGAPARFAHHRCLKSRGEGHARIPAVVTAPGPAGLDAAAKALVRSDAQLSVEEYPDERPPSRTQSPAGWSKPSKAVTRSPTFGTVPISVTFPGQGRCGPTAALVR